MDNKILTPEFRRRFNEWYNRIYTRIEIAHPELSDSEIVTAISEEQILTPPIYNGPHQKETRAFGPQRTIRVFKYITQDARTYLNAMNQPWRRMFEDVWYVLVEHNGPDDIKLINNVFTVQSTGIELIVNDGIAMCANEGEAYQEGKE